MLKVVETVEPTSTGRAVNFTECKKVMRQTLISKRLLQERVHDLVPVSEFHQILSVQPENRKIRRTKNQKPDHTKSPNLVKCHPNPCQDSSRPVADKRETDGNREKRLSLLAVVLTLKLHRPHFPALLIQMNRRKMKESDSRQTEYRVLNEFCPLSFFLASFERFMRTHTHTFSDRSMWDTTRHIQTRTQ